MSDTARHVVGLGTILILEDEVLVSMVIEGLLHDMGAGAVLVHSETGKALDAVETVGVDLAILDVHLGDGTSFEVADALDARGIPFMFSSALGAVALEGRHGHRPMLSKPFADEDLRAQVLGLVRP